MNALPSLLIPLCAALGLAGLATADDAPPTTAAELAARLSALQQDGTSYVRLKMEIKEGSATKATYQMQIKQRRTSSASDVIYQILFPRERKGESVLLHQSTGHSPTGTHFVPPDNAQPLDSSKMKEGLFGSDLSWNDAIENFYAWPRQTLAGTEEINGTSCQVLESKPGKGDSSSYAAVKSWIDLRHMVPLRVEKYLPSGQLGRRIDTTNIDADDKGRSLPSSLTVRRPGGDSITVIEGSRIKHDVIYSEADFTANGLKNLAAPRS
jgi:outer membrane lipoprotein-sorting protein